MALAGLVLAIGDGMAVSLLVRPGEIDDDAVYRLLEAMVLSLADDAAPGVSAAAPAPARLPHGARRVGAASGARGTASPGPEPLDDLAPGGPASSCGEPGTSCASEGSRRSRWRPWDGRPVSHSPSITYYFGDKQGLITALIVSQFHEQRKAGGAHGRRLRRAVTTAGGAVCAARELLTDMKSFRVFYDLLPVMTARARVPGAAGGARPLARTA